MYGYGRHADQLIVILNESLLKAMKITLVFAYQLLQCVEIKREKKMCQNRILEYSVDFQVVYLDLTDESGFSSHTTDVVNVSLSDKKDGTTTFFLTCVVCLKTYM